MPRHLKYLLAASLLAGFAASPTSPRAETGAKTGAAKSAEKSSAGAASDFEENRKAHMQKSKENNDKKGAN